MACNHERIKSVNCEIFCDVCGAKLPVDYLLIGKERLADQKAAEPQETEPVKQETPAKKRATGKRGTK